MDYSSITHWCISPLVCFYYNTSISTKVVYTIPISKWKIYIVGNRKWLVSEVTWYNKNDDKVWIHNPSFIMVHQDTKWICYCARFGGESNNTYLLLSLLEQSVMGWATSVKESWNISKRHQWLICVQIFLPRKWLFAHEHFCSDIDLEGYGLI